MQKTCLKCGHVNAAASGAEMKACPACGAIYRRVEALAAAGGVGRRAVTEPEPEAMPEPAPVVAPRLPPRSAPAASPPAPDPGTVQPARADAARQASRAFLQRLREQTHYPTFRAVVRFCEILGYAAAVLLAVLAGVLIKNGAINAGVYAAIGAFVWAVLARAAKELFFMLADGVDGIVRLAAQGEAAPLAE